MRSRVIMRTAVAVRTSIEAPPGALPSGPGGAPTERFTAYVSKNLRPPVLRYSQRAEFLREARRLGVARFEAHLIIAAAVYRLGVGAAADVPPTRARRWIDEWAVPLMACATVQGLIAVGAWWVVG